jgi:hypothetical protein
MDKRSNMCSKPDDKSKEDDTSGLALLIRKVEPEAKDIINEVLCAGELKNQAN